MPGTTSAALPPFSHDQQRETDAEKGVGWAGMPQYLITFGTHTHTTRVWNKTSRNCPLLLMGVLILRCEMKALNVRTLDKMTTTE